MKKYNVAIVGATGLVGSMFLTVLQEKNIPIKNLYCYASAKSAGKIINFGCKRVEVLELCEKNIKNKKIDFALFSAGGAISKEFIPFFARQGAVVIDNSSAFRMEKDIPLVVPQVNFGGECRGKKIIANPNCSTIQCMAPLKILNDLFTLKAVNFTTYQAVSGSGIKGIKDLELTQNGEAPQFYPYPICNNCLPHIGNFLSNGYTEEEMKMINETQKILQQSDLKVSATCVRVPVKNSHSVSIDAEVLHDVDVDLLKSKLENFEGIIVVDEPDENGYPFAEMATGTDNIFIGRIRKDIFNPYVIHMFVVADNIRKGAASNAVEILERLIS